MAHTPSKRPDDRPDVARALEGGDPPDESRVTKLISAILDFGLDGLGPLDSAGEVAESARSSTTSTEQAINKVIRRHVAGGGVGGFATGLGGFFTMPVAIPANVVEFYVQAARMVGAIAQLRGYDLTRPNVRTAVLLALVGSQADEVLKKAGLATGTGKITALALERLPDAAVLVLNKAIGFRLLRTAGTSVFSRFGKAVPVLGGVLGAGFDGWMMHRIAEHAKTQFPQR